MYMERKLHSNVDVFIFLNILLNSMQQKERQERQEERERENEEGQFNNFV